MNVLQVLTGKTPTSSVASRVLLLSRPCDTRQHECMANSRSKDHSINKNLHVLTDVLDCDDLTSFLQYRLSLPHASGILISAPPGAGKTTVCIRSASATGRPMMHLGHDTLVAPRAGDIEAAVGAFFALALAAAPAVVFLDNIDSVAPAEARGPADLRAVASLDSIFDDFELDKESSSGLVVLATASYPCLIHPCLTRRARLDHVIDIKPPNWTQRKAFLASAMCAFPVGKSSPVEYSSVQSYTEKTAGHSKESDSLLDDLSSITPGFLPADLVALLSGAYFSCRRALGSSNRTLAVVELLSRAKIHVHDLRPILMTSAGSLWQSIPWTPNAPNVLCGLDPQVQLIAGCLHAAFQHSNCHSNPGKRALQVLGSVPGAILYGPTASGKSALARLAPSFLPRGTVNAFCLESSEIVGCFIGESERKLQAIFALARAAAPTILVIENIDVLAPRRIDLSEDSSSSSATTFHRILSTLLIELDGVVAQGKSGTGSHLESYGQSNEGPRNNIFVIATTSNLSHVDPAIFRPGRLEVHVKLTLPHLQARKELLLRFLEQLPSSNNRNRSSALHDRRSWNSWIERIAEETDGWSTVDLQALCQEAVLRSIRERNAFDSSDSENADKDIYVERKHFDAALRTLK